MNKKRIAFHTLGCKLNFAESSGLIRELETDCHVVDFSDIADYYIVHSCAVTATAEKKCRTYIRQAHKRNPDAVIVVIGCMAQLRPGLLGGMEGVNLVLGNTEKFNLKNFLKGDLVQHNVHINVSNILKNKSFYSSFSGFDRTRTFIKIQDGCDYFCTYCTIPFARGNSRSNNVAATIKQIKSALKSNPKEVILTGVNIGDFGKTSKETLFDLLKEIETIKNYTRIRLSSIEPDLLTDSIIKLVACSEKFMPHFHIPLQSGSDHVLKRMNRRYNSDLFIERVNLIQKTIHHACIAADVIVGFPGETQEEFNDTYSLIEQLPLSYLHIFPYSERPGTRAASFPDKVRPEIIRERVEKLLLQAQNKKLSFLSKNHGRIEEVLFESDNFDGYMSGFTTNYIRVKAPFRNEWINSIKKTRLEILDTDNMYCYTSC